MSSTGVDDAIESLFRTARASIAALEMERDRLTRWLEAIADQPGCSGEMLARMARTALERRESGYSTPPDPRPAPDGEPPGE